MKDRETAVQQAHAEKEQLDQELSKQKKYLAETNKRMPLQLYQVEENGSH